MGWRQVVDEIGHQLAPGGLDLVHGFRLSWYNDAVEPPLALPDLGRPGALGVLVASTRALWPRLVAALEAEPELREGGHPVDSYVERTVRTSLAELGHRFELRFAPEAPPRRVALQRLAELSGFAPLSPGQLVAHPVYGPWIALRAVVVVDLDGPTGTAPPAIAPCLGCSAPCLPAFEQAIAEADARTDHAVLHERWRPWLAVRDACPVGREHRYSEPQILYHYARRWA